MVSKNREIVNLLNDSIKKKMRSTWQMIVVDV